MEVTNCVQSIDDLIWKRICDALCEAVDPEPSLKAHRLAVRVGPTLDKPLDDLFEESTQIWR